MKSQALTGDCDYLELVENDRNINGIYFNIKILFENKQRSNEQIIESFLITLK